MSTQTILERIVDKIDSIQNDIDYIWSEEEDYLYNIPENLQSSDRYFLAEEAVDNLESASESVGNASAALQKYIEGDANE